MKSPLFLFLCIHKMLCLLLSCADDQTTARQTELMQRFLGAETYLTDDTHRRKMFWQYMAQADDETPDPCTWFGVECKFSQIIAFFMTSVGKGDAAGRWRLIWKVRMDWLPPTLRAVHLINVHMRNGWASEKLPRELRYLALRNCAMYGGVSYEVDLRRLPSAMEELHVIGGWYSGEVCIDALPKSMQWLILLMTGSSVSTAYVDSRSLPDSLVQAVVLVNSETIKIREISKRKPDARVTAKEAFRVVRSEQYTERAKAVQRLALSEYNYYSIEE